jgi:aerobic-type carbon monoxide dehydrogenase small subunit (CoxS/CutS family)/CO/xanthine dehydrogenase FAD-binding subunit
MTSPGRRHGAASHDRKTATVAGSRRGKRLESAGRRAEKEGRGTLLARGIRSYHRPTRLEEALDLAAQGVTPLGGGTRLLASPVDVPNILDLVGLGLTQIRVVDEDLHVEATASLQEVVDAPVAYATTAGLLPLACRNAAPPTVRGAATLGGEAVAADPDSVVVAALLALNAVFVIAHPREPRESPALRFARRPQEDLEGGGLVTTIAIPGAPHGAALEKASLLPSLPPLVAVAVTTTFSGQRLARVRLAVTGLDGPPARVTEAEVHLERTAGGDDALREAADIVARDAAFRSDAWAGAAARARMGRALSLRALRAAVQRGRRREPALGCRPRPAAGQRAPAPLPNFTSGRLEMTLNGHRFRAAAQARTSLLELLRGAGFYGVKEGCGVGRCGACAVLLDGQPVASCLTLAVRAQGRSVVTIEGLGTSERPHPLQVAFAEAGAIQCGFCTPALVLRAKALLDASPRPSEEEVREALDVLCRCTGYAKPVQAVLEAARRIER